MRNGRLAAPGLRRLAIGMALLGVAPLVGCGEEGAGSVKISAGNKDKTNVIEPDFGDGGKPAAEKPGKGGAMKDIKSRNAGG